MEVAGASGRRHIVDADVDVGVDVGDYVDDGADGVFVRLSSTLMLMFDGQVPFEKWRLLLFGANRLYAVNWNSSRCFVVMC